MLYFKWKICLQLFKVNHSQGWDTKLSRRSSETGSRDPDGNIGAGPAGPPLAVTARQPVAAAEEKPDLFPCDGNRFFYGIEIDRIEGGDRIQTSIGNF